MIDVVCSEFESFDPVVLDQSFVTLQCVIACIYRATGDNEFALPHAGKDKFVKAGNLNTTTVLVEVEYDDGTVELDEESAAELMVESEEEVEEDGSYIDLELYDELEMNEVGEFIVEIE